MKATRYLISYMLTLIAFLILDLMWLGFIANGIYEKFLGYLMAEEVNWGAAIVFYSLFVASLFVFVIRPSIKKNSPTSALALGGFFGLVTYATFELTNYATLKGWPIQMVVIDMLWGTILGAIVCIVGYFITKILVKE